MKRILLICFVLMSSLISEAWAQRTVSGQVTSGTDQEGIPGVNVVIKGTSQGVITDFEGRYRIEVPSNDAVLRFSAIGFLNQEVTVGNRSTIDVVLAEDVKQLNEVVVTGYGSILKSEFTGASASVSAEDLANLPVISPDQALQGQAPGVFVTSSSGAPGGGIKVTVRGQTSINASNDPLYVIDGVPVVSGNMQQTAFGGQGQNALSGLNPNDIESMEVLKDAASTAIYGARAANGVVLITTKRGKAGRTSINFNARKGWATETNRIDMVNAEEWIELRNEARANAGQAPLNFDGASDTDWLDEVLRVGEQEEYQLSIGGGDEKLRYYLSGSYRNEEGIVLGSGYQRGTLRLNVDHKANERLNVGTSLFIASDLNERIQNDNNIYGVVSTAILTNPTYGIYDENGDYTVTPFAHPIASATEPRYDNSTTKGIFNIYASYDILPTLTFRADASYDYNFLREDHFEPVTTAQGRPNGFGQYNTRQIGTYNIEPTLRYSNRINDVHNISFLAGSTVLGRTDHRSSIGATGFPEFDNLTYLTSAANIDNFSSYTEDYNFMSVFGRLNYSFAGKYLMSATLRRDGSSRFGENNKFGTFWAASAGWNFSEEGFLSDVEWLELGKIRASYGVTGNDRIGNFGSLGVYTASADYLGRSAIRPSQIANPELRWEETATLDIGLELALFRNRLNVNLGYFNAQTTDLLLNAPVPGTTGFTSYDANVGEMRNSGIELELTTVNVDYNKFKWTTSINVTKVENEIVNLIDDIRFGFTSIAREGYPINSFEGFRFLGVDPATGNSMYEDINGDGQITTAGDFTIIGDHSPDYYGGMTNSFRYGGLSLDVFLQFVNGVDIYNNTRQFTETTGSNTYGQMATVLNRWRQPGDITDVPRATTAPGLNHADSDRFLENGDYMRLKNVTLAYDFGSSLSRLNIQNLRLYVSGQNLFTFTEYKGFDPEVSTFAETNTAAGTDFLTFPQTRVISVGVNLGL